MNAAVAAIIFDDELTTTPALPVAQAQAPKPTESGRDFRRRQIRELYALLQDAPLFMEPEMADRFERQLLGPLNELAREAAKRMGPNSGLWHRAHVRIQQDVKDRRAALDVLQFID